MNINKKNKKFDPEQTRDEFFNYLTNLIQTENIIEDFLDSPKK
jgi:non-homologous end joining protein Ku